MSCFLRRPNFLKQKHISNHLNTQYTEACTVCIAMLEEGEEFLQINFEKLFGDSDYECNI
jgi:hypothetical protein